MSNFNMNFYYMNDAILYVLSLTHYFYFCSGRVSPSCPDWAQTDSVMQADFELAILLPHAPKPLRVQVCASRPSFIKFPGTVKKGTLSAHLEILHSLRASSLTALKFLLPGSHLTSQPLSNLLLLIYSRVLASFQALNPRLTSCTGL